MSKTEEILEHLPKKTPSWAIGTVTIIVAIVTSLLTFYLASRTEIQQAMSWSQKHHDQVTDAQLTESSVTLDTILKLLNVKSQQILELSKSVSSTQENNFVLLQRVDLLEKKVDEISSSLTECRKNLMLCERTKK